MKKLMNAIEAKRTVDECLDKASESKWDEIVDGINRAINEGKYTYSFQDTLPENIRRKLFNLGYSIRSGSQYNVPWVVISWDNARMMIDVDETVAEPRKKEVRE